jgi:hypothetical protein
MEVGRRSFCFFDRVGFNLAAHSNYKGRFRFPPESRPPFFLFKLAIINQRHSLDTDRDAPDNINSSKHPLEAARFRCPPLDPGDGPLQLRFCFVHLQHTPSLVTRLSRPSARL